MSETTISAVDLTAPRARRGRFSLVVALALLAIAAVVVAAIFGPLLAPDDPNAQDLLVGLSSPGGAHLFGTDDLGRDVLSGVLHGARISLLVGVVTAATAAFVGTGVGATAGFYGGSTDDLLMRLTEFVQVIPRFFLAVLVAALFGPSIVFLVLLFGLTFWPGTARLVRSQVLSLREREYVVAARSVGLRDGRILVRHVLPNVLAPALVMASYYVALAIVVEAGLSFIGMGAQPPLPSLGVMAAEGRNYMLGNHWVTTVPGLAILFVVLGLNLLGDGLRDTLDVRGVRDAG